MSVETWQVLWTREAVRSLSHVPPRVLPAVITFVDERLTTNPLRVTHALRPPLEGYRSGSVGSFRVLVKVDAAENTVYVVKVAYHADVYRPRT